MTMQKEGQGQMWKVKVTEIKIQFSRFRTVTLVWIQMWWRNDAQSLMLLRRVALLFFRDHPSNFNVTRLKKLLILTQFGCFRTVTPVWSHWQQWNNAQSLKQHKRGAPLFLRSSVKFQGHMGPQIADFDPNWAFLDCNSSLNSPMAFKWCTKLNVV